ncbi:MAG: response regulator [Sediminibacterium sp.]
MKTVSGFIVIDDDSVNNMLCRLQIKSVSGQLDIQTFEDPEAGFAFISKTYAGDQPEKTIVLLLDINMPTWTGWDFLEHFDQLDEHTKKQVKIYLLSSSIDPNDKERAARNKYVIDYIVKPLTREMVKSVVVFHSA